MTKRILDGMSAEQIAEGVFKNYGINEADGWAESQGLLTRDDLVEYLESLCKPKPSWEDDVAFNAVLCFVGNSKHQLESKNIMAYIYNVWPDPVYKYGAGNGCNWKHARPISPNECWKPTEKGEC